MQVMDGNLESTVISSSPSQFGRLSQKQSGKKPLSPSPDSRPIVHSELSAVFSAETLEVDSSDKPVQPGASSSAPPLLPKPACPTILSRPTSFLSSNMQSFLSGLSPLDSPIFGPSKLAARVKHIDGQISKAPILSDKSAFPALCSTSGKTLPSSSLNAGPKGSSK